MKKLLPCFVLGVMLTIVACTKYKDDPFISLRTAYGRLYGTWHVDYFEINGIDSTTYLQTNNLNNINLDVTFYKKEPTYHESNQACMLADCNNFSLGKKQILWNCFYNSFGFKYWDILKLYKSDFWININYQNRNYFIKLKKQ